MKTVIIVVFVYVAIGNFFATLIDDGYGGAEGILAFFLWPIVIPLICGFLLAEKIKETLRE